MANDLVANTDWKGNLAPSSSDGVNIGATDTTALNLDINVICAKLLWFELRRRLATHVSCRRRLWENN